MYENTWSVERLSLSFLVRRRIKKKGIPWVKLPQSALLQTECFSVGYLSQHHTVPETYQVHTKKQKH